MKNSDFTKSKLHPWDFARKYCKPLFYEGKVLEDYWVDPDGDIWTSKIWRNFRTLTPQFRNSYPRVTLTDFGKRKHVDMHRLVCSTFHKFPCPNGVTKKEWKDTPDSVKKLIQNSFQVNHIDHDTYNYHPSNLEWVSVKENSQKYQEYRVTNHSYYNSNEFIEAA